MELRSNGSMTGPMSTGVRSSMLQDLELDRSNSVGTALWWVALMLLVTAVPAFASLVLMGSVTLAVTTALLTVGGVGLAALMI